MAAQDIFHKTVCTALEKEGWTITHDPTRGKILKVDCVFEGETEFPNYHKEH
ncbi:MAG: hypothetical protein J7647_17210 [Cyanobacteria bacterium SBLK]|nr:hypothetical protein [Cyanobacteria bacterium SBLK]